MNTSFFQELLGSIAERGRALVDRSATAARPGRAGAGPGSGDAGEPLPRAWFRAAARPRAWRWPGRCSTSTPPRRCRPGSSSSACSPAASTPTWRGIRPPGRPTSRTRRRHTCRRCWRRSSRRARSCSAASTSPPAARRPWCAMREDLLEHGGKEAGSCASVDDDFAHLFGSWFNRGFLVLRPIDWSTPADILERIIRYEAVHEIQGWDDLRRRVAAARPPLLRLLPPVADRRAADLRRGGADPRDPGLDPAAAGRGARRSCRPSEATTAVFYSISNCQQGLRGVSFGNFLIKQVVEELSRELPALADLRHAVAGAGLRALARPGAGRRRRCRPRGTERRRSRRSRAGLARGRRPPKPCASRCCSRRRYYLARQGRRRQAGRSGGALPPRQRRPARAPQLAGRHRRPRACARRTA